MSSFKLILGVVGVCILLQSVVAAGTDGLVADWRFDEGQGEVAHDSSGNQNDLKLHDVQWVKSGEGYAIELTGAESYAECPLSDSLKPKEAVSIEAWIKPTFKSWEEPDIFGATTNAYRLGYSNRGTCWWFVNSHSDDVGGKLALGKWNYIAGTFDGKQRSMWINGQFCGTRTSPPLKGQDGSFIIGSHSEAGFHGVIDRLRIYAQPLSREQALSHYHAEAAQFGIDTKWFSRVKVRPYYYFDQGLVVVDADYGGLLPMEGKGKLDVTLASRSAPAKALERQTVEPLPPWGNVPVSVPLPHRGADHYVIDVVLSDDKGPRPTEQIEFDYPPAPQKLPSPSERTVAALPPAPAPTQFGVELKKGGGFVLKMTGASYPFRSKVSWPNGEFNCLSPDDAPAGKSEESWKPLSRVVREGLYEVDASGAYYKIHREIEVLPTRINISDTYTNTTEQDLGLLVYNELPLQHPPAPGSRLCGYETMGRVEDVLSPHYGGASLFIKEGRDGIGMLPMDDVSIVQSLMYLEKKVAGMGTEKLALGPRSSYTLKWEIYPTGSGDYWDFINAYRTDEDLIGTVDAEPGFITYGPNNRRQLPTRQFMENRGIKYAILANLAKPVDNSEVSLEGIEFIDFPKEQRLIRDQAMALQAKFPGVKVMFHIAHTLFATNQANRFADSRITGPNGVPKASGGPGSFGAKAIADGWCWRLCYPTPGNSFHEALMKSVDVMMDDMDCYGAFVDGFMLGYGGRWTYNRWDGHSAEIDPKTKTIKRKIGSVLLLMQPSMIEYARKIHDRGGIVIANGNVMTPTIAKEKYIIFDEERASGPECHLAPTLFSLSQDPFSDEKEVYFDILEKLSWGDLYIYNNERVPLTHPMLTAREFPITFQDVRAGTIRGPERIITMNSGVYGWPEDRNLHRVYKFDGRGAPAESDFVSTSDSDGVRTELDLGEHESAVIERVPVSIESAAPVNALVQDYCGKHLKMLLNGHGDATVTMFVGTDYPDRRGGIFTDGGVSRLDVGVSDPYRVTAGARSEIVREQDGTLNVKLTLDGQEQLTIEEDKK